MQRGKGVGVKSNRKNNIETAQNKSHSNETKLHIYSTCFYFTQEQASVNMYTFRDIFSPRVSVLFAYMIYSERRKSFRFSFFLVLFGSFDEKFSILPLPCEYGSDSPGSQTYHQSSRLGAHVASFQRLADRIISFK